MTRRLGNGQAEQPTLCIVVLRFLDSPNFPSFGVLVPTSTVIDPFPMKTGKIDQQTVHIQEKFGSSYFSLAILIYINYWTSSINSGQYA